MFSAADHLYMARALVLARRPVISPHPNPRVGCVLVREGRVVGEGWHRQAGAPHAEAEALRVAGAQAAGSTAYVSLEPCSHHGRTPPCADALIAAGVRRVVAAMVDPNPRVAGRGLRRLAEAGVDTAQGLMVDEAEALNRGFVKRMREGLPWVRLKLALSLDGRSAMASGESRWITAAPARADVQRLRARADALLSGSGTVLADDPRLDLRAEELGSEVTRQPLRVVVDGRARLHGKLRMLHDGGAPVLVARCEQRPLAGAEVLALPGKNARVNLRALLKELARREINEIQVEAGAGLNGALLAAGLVDEIIVYLAPVLMGDGALGAFHLPGLERMSQVRRLQIDELRPLGEDWRIRARPIYHEVTT